MTETVHSEISVVCFEVMVTSEEDKVPTTEISAVADKVPVGPGVWV